MEFVRISGVKVHYKVLPEKRLDLIFDGNYGQIQIDYGKSIPQSTNWTFGTLIFTRKYSPVVTITREKKQMSNDSDKIKNVLSVHILHHLNCLWLYDLLIDFDYKAEYRN